MKAQYFLVVICLACLCCSYSCKKDDASTGNYNEFIHIIPSDSDMACVASFQMNDGNFLVASRNMNNDGRGMIVKMDLNGNIIWKKYLSPLNNVLYQVMKKRSSGFITLGLSETYSPYFTACIYNDDGNLISSHDIFNQGASSVFSMIELRNGDYAIAGGENGLGFGYVILADNALSHFKTRTFFPPPGFSQCFINGICEMPDGSLAMAASSMGFNSNGNPLQNSFLIKYNPDNLQQSETMFNDTMYSETPNCLITNAGGLVSVTARMTGFNTGDGTFVNYLNNNNSELISGTISVNQLNTDGQLVSRNLVHSYPQNGMINSINPTSDGGYILCGTVNQENSFSIVSHLNIFLLKVNAQLTAEWSKTYSTTYQSLGISALQTPDGGYLVSGHHRSFNSRYNLIVMKTDAAGNPH